MKKIFITVTTILIAIIGVLFGVSLISRQVSVGRSELTVTAGNRWSVAYSHYVNERGLNMVIDGSEQSRGVLEHIYMDEEMNLMLGRDVVRDAFNCAVDLYGGNRVVIAKGDIVAEMMVGEYSMTVTRATAKTPEQTVLGSTCIMDSGELYIPAEMLEKGIGYSYEWNQDTLSAELMNKDPYMAALPSYYNYAETGKITQIRNQGDLGACWAFASAAAMESSLLPEESWDFSEDHMIYNNVFDVDQDANGDYLMAAAYLLSWKGPVNEADDPYNDGETDPDLKAVKHLQEIQFLENKDCNDIKEMVFRYGAVECSVHIGVRDDMYVDPQFYNADKKAYCYTGSEPANHEVVIIGWDDNFAASDFSTKIRGNGAFICKNSWGSDFGDEGIFYVSYYDSVIGQKSEVYTRIDDPDNYDAIYQYDYAGWVGSMGFDRNKAYMANVFTAEDDESVSAVGFYATGEKTSYKVYVISDYTGPESLNINSDVAASGTFENAGYYTVDLDSETAVHKGDDFAVIVEIDTPGSSRPVAVEISAGDERTGGVVINGRSYISNYGDRWEYTQKENECTICLKAYTKKQVNYEDNHGNRKYK